MKRHFYNWTLPKIYWGQAHFVVRRNGAMPPTTIGTGVPENGRPFSTFAAPPIQKRTRWAFVILKFLYAKQIPYKNRTNASVGLAPRAFVLLHLTQLKTELVPIF